MIGYQEGIKNLQPKKSAGFSIILAIFVVLITTFLVLSTSTLITTDSDKIVRHYNSLRAFFIAEAGLQFAVASSLEGKGDWRTFTALSKNFAGGSFTVQNLTTEANLALLRVTGTYPAGSANSVTRTIQQTFYRAYTLPEAFNYALYWNNSAGATTLDLGSWLFSSNITGNCFGAGNFDVSSNSGVTGGTIYVSPGHRVTGSGTYTWEVLSSFPAFPLLDNTYYTNLISYYDSIIPTVAAPAYTWGSTNHVITLNGETVSFESITINLSGGLTVRGSGELVSRGDIDVNGDIYVVPNTGETIALVAQNKIDIGPWGSNSADFFSGTHLYSKNGRCQFTKFLGSFVNSEDVLVMSKNRVSLSWFGSNLGDNSIIYIPPDATGSSNLVVDVDFTSDIFHGSIINDCNDSSQSVRFLVGGMTGIVYSRVCPVILSVGGRISGSVVADEIRTILLSNTCLSDIDWAESFLPTIPPPGLSEEAVTAYPSSWQEVY
ncbi:hypothetical protein A2291_02550 [candidate division WOR-1 bacterium RIFOXYB2_FULL_42_35]|uniref:Type 4 fimbrial biogenesis protein PilX N-terminal domain-containing protein n=1 Tax=candidate division WOR-1 bacterium RIFOXYC2_FULL_41_25 TaxID=1802586 RepID=A0A1F4TR24_UNCSA|nr:MAG: hypothetical protein A2247_05455 [candidate division WOR-1 bacterium RIFOXYA2_FULL_41_14]OGC25103.1 MAG: hypothetical protein A2291_02550 [candidate division WOR-1 bacterium RIFOXYB2_FULL_42_35]OGC34503.1 MAG: hypothetical protein A2462_04370 [candidate division WOR-1 bacterium RIFOXYC2_FULL_41_25]